MKCVWPVNLLTLCSPRISENSINIKINLDYFLTSLWRLKRFYEGLQSFHKTFWGTSKKCENKYLSLFSLFVRIRTGKINSIRHFVYKPSAFAHLIFFIQAFWNLFIFLFVIWFLIFFYINCLVIWRSQFCLRIYVNTAFIPGAVILFENNSLKM